MKDFESVEFEVIALQAEDVITNSIGTDPVEP